MANDWQDKSFALYGKGIWVPVFFLIFFAAGMIWMFCLHKTHTEADIFFIVVLPLLLEIRGIFYTVQFINVLQEIAIIDDKGLAGKCFFGRMLDCDVADIKSLTYYSITWKTCQINSSYSKIPGINIVLKNGDLFRISSGIEDFLSLVEALKTLAAEAKHIECNL